MPIKKSAADWRNHLFENETIIIGPGWFLEKWDYNNRRNMQEIIPGLFLGPYAVAIKSKLEYLKEHEISHIICIRDEREAHFIKPNFEDHFKYLTLKIADSKYENIIQYFRTVNNFITDAINKGGKVLVHSNTGLSRSAALVIAYLIERYNVSFNIAHKHVQNKRLCIALNEGFVSQIMEYEVICQACKELVNSSPVPTNNKRSYDEL